MTSNSIQYMANLEQQRHNAVNEAETHRNNLVIEGIRQGELAVSQRNAESKAKEVSLQAKETKANVAYKKASTKKTKAEVRKVKAETKNVKADTKKKKSEVKNIKSDTAKKKRETKHYDVAEAQEQQKIANQRIANQLTAERNAIQDSYNKMQFKLGSTKNNNDAQRIQNDFLKQCFDNPALLAYTGLVDSNSTGKKVRKDVKTAFGSVVSAISKGTGGFIDGISAAQKLARSGKITKKESAAIIDIIKGAYMAGGPVAGWLTEKGIILSSKKNSTNIKNVVKKKVSKSLTKK